jgi:hypothetical protein
LKLSITDTYPLPCGCYLWEIRFLDGEVQLEDVVEFEILEKGRACIRFETLRDGKKAIREEFGPFRAECRHTRPPYQNGHTTIEVVV